MPFVWDNEQGRYVDRSDEELQSEATAATESRSSTLDGGYLAQEAYDRTRPAAGPAVAGQATQDFFDSQNKPFLSGNVGDIAADAALITGNAFTGLGTDVLDIVSYVGDLGRAGVDLLNGGGFNEDDYLFNDSDNPWTQWRINFFEKNYRTEAAKAVSDVVRLGTALVVPSAGMAKIGFMGAKTGLVAGTVGKALKGPKALVKGAVGRIAGVDDYTALGEVLSLSKGFDKLVGKFDVVESKKVLDAMNAVNTPKAKKALKLFEADDWLQAPLKEVIARANKQGRMGQVVGDDLSRYFNGVKDAVRTVFGGYKGSNKIRTFAQAFAWDALATFNVMGEGSQGMDETMGNFINSTFDMTGHPLGWLANSVTTQAEDTALTRKFKGLTEGLLMGGVMNVGFDMLRVFRFSKAIRGANPDEQARILKAFGEEADELGTSLIGMPDTEMTGQELYSSLRKGLSNEYSPVGRGRLLEGGPQRQLEGGSPAGLLPSGPARLDGSDPAGLLRPGFERQGASPYALNNLDQLLGTVDGARSAAQAEDLARFSEAELLRAQTPEYSPVQARLAVMEGKASPINTIEGDINRLDDALRPGTPYSKELGLDPEVQSALEAMEARVPEPVVDTPTIGAALRSDLKQNISRVLRDAPQDVMYAVQERINKLLPPNRVDALEYLQQSRRRMNSYGTLPLEQGLISDAVYRTGLRDGWVRWNPDGSISASRKIAVDIDEGELLYKEGRAIDAANAAFDQAESIKAARQEGVGDIDPAVSNTAEQAANDARKIEQYEAAEAQRLGRYQRLGAVARQYLEGQAVPQPLIVKGEKGWDIVDETGEVIGNARTKAMAEGKAKKVMNARRKEMQRMAELSAEDDGWVLIDAEAPLALSQDVTSKVKMSDAQLRQVAALDPKLADEIAADLAAGGKTKRTYELNQAQMQNLSDSITQVLDEGGLPPSTQRSLKTLRDTLDTEVKVLSEEASLTNYAKKAVNQFIELLDNGQICNPLDL